MTQSTLFGFVPSSLPINSRARVHTKTPSSVTGDWSPLPVRIPRVRLAPEVPREECRGPRYNNE